ncbi:MAG: 3D domain-containing protein [Clostridia bacterium]|nr:3D domain-containing protein [Clostridia bacterium]
MKTEQVIVLRKKTIVMFSLFILAFTMGMLNIQKNTVNAASINEVKKVYTNYVANEDLFKVEVVGNVEPVKQRVVEEVPIATSVYTVQSVVTEQNGGATQSDQGISSKVASRGSYIRDTNVAPTDYEKVITVRATAYCLCQKCTGKTPSSAGYGHTASGIVITPGRDMKIISVDPSVIPLGTEVYVEGYGYAIAGDTGGAIKGNKIDVYKDTHSLALQWGVKNVNVYILKDE